MARGGPNWYYIVIVYVTIFQGMVSFFILHVDINFLP